MSVHAPFDPETMHRTPSPGSRGDTSEFHLRRILGRISAELRSKYTAGQAEHGGILSRKPTIRPAIDEAVDQVVYLFTLEEQAQRASSYLKRFLLSGNRDDAVKCYAILTTGNEDGEVYPD